MRCVIPGCGERFGAGKSGYGKWIDTGFCAAGEHDVCVIEHNKARGVTDRVGAGGAGRRDGMVGATEGVFDGDMTSGEVDKKARNEERGYFFITL